MRKAYLDVILLTALLLFPNSILLKDKVITLETEGTSIIGDGITISDAKIFAVNYAKQTALEQVGTYLESNTTVLNYVVEKDEIKTFTGSVLKTEILTEEKCMVDNNFALKVKIKAMIDTETLNKRLEDVRNNSELQKTLEAERKKVEELTKKVAEYEKDNNSTKEETAAIARSLEAADWYNKGYDAYINGKYEVAVDYYSTAIELDPKFFIAYNNRGVVYKAINDNNKAIMDYNKALELNPNYINAYLNRGISYEAMKDYTKAITDYGRVIELDAMDVFAYNNRGVAYKYANDIAKAISDYSKAIELDPKYASPYLNRAICFYHLKDDTKVISDLNNYLKFAGDKYGDADKIRKWIRDLGGTPKY